MFIAKLLPRSALMAMALMASVPFLISRHTSPIPSFHAEWLAGLFGLIAGCVVIGARQLPLPGATLLASSLAGIAMLQAASGHAPVPQLSELFILYLFWAALLAAAASHLAAVLGRARLTRALSSALLLGALLVAVLGLLRPWPHVVVSWGIPLQHGGLLLQANHLTLYLWIGLASALYLRATARLSRTAFWLAATLATLAAALAGQRSSFLYAGTLIAAAAWSARQASAEKPTEGLRLAVGICLLFMAMQPLVMLLPAQGTNEAKPPPAMRAVTEWNTPSLRLQLWHLGANGIMDAPMLGNGIGSFPGLALMHADSIPLADNPGLTEHAHNLFVHLGAELGAPAALLVAVAAGMWLRHLPQRAAAAEVPWAAAVSVMLGLHSMIEYPLWYSNFLGLLAVVAGAFGSPFGKCGRLVSVALALPLLAGGGLTLFELKRDYAHLELALTPGEQPAAQYQKRTALLRVPQRSLLAPWVSTTACVSLDPLSVPVVDGLAVCRVAIVFAPSMECGANLAVLLWRTGDGVAAQDLLRRLRLASRNDPDKLDVLLAPLIARKPGLSALMQNISFETKKAGRPAFHTANSF